MEGCSAPLVVKFADTQKEKEQKKVQQMQVAILSTIKGTGTTPTASLGITPTIAASESITPSLSGTNGTAPTAASLPINFGLNSSGRLSKHSNNSSNQYSKVSKIQIKIDDFFALFYFQYKYRMV